MAQMKIIATTLALALTGCSQGSPTGSRVPEDTSEEPAREADPFAAFYAMYATEDHEFDLQAISALDAEEFEQFLGDLDNDERQRFYAEVNAAQAAYAASKGTTGYAVALCAVSVLAASSCSSLLRDELGVTTSAAGCLALVQFVESGTVSVDDVAAAVVEAQIENDAVQFALTVAGFMACVDKNRG